jgi:ketosteroid isomerase-like protein
LGANGDYVRGFAEAWNRGELDRFIDDADPDFEWVAAREHPDALTNRGIDATAEYLRDWLQTMPDLKIEIEELVEAGDRVLAVMRMTGTGAGSGAQTEVRMAMISTFRNGMPLRTEEFLDPEEARRTLGA